MAVARAAGVSPSTVSNAFNRPERLSPALRERVLRVAAELGYGGPDPAARILRGGRAGAIAVILGRLIADALGDPATIQFLTGVSDATDPQQLGARARSRDAVPRRPATAPPYAMPRPTA